jgi:Xaa-Pro aminopeptidase
LVTHSNALLWTDGRYYLQASQQLDKNWELMKDGLSETPSIGDWLIKNLPQRSLVGIDSTLYEESLFQSLASKLKEINCELVDTKQNLIDLIWNECDKPIFEYKELIQLDIKYTGNSVSQKLDTIREQMIKLNCDAMVVSSLDG